MSGEYPQHGVWTVTSLWCGFVPKWTRVPNVVPHAEIGVPSAATPAPEGDAYAALSAEACPPCSVQLAPEAGAVAVLRASLSSPEAVERMPPKKARRPPSAVRTRS